MKIYYSESHGEYYFLTGDMVYWYVVGFDFWDCSRISDTFKNNPALELVAEIKD